MRVMVKYSGDERVESKKAETLVKNVVSPYALSAKDDLENIVTRVVFNGKNYDEWARKMRTGLHTKKKLGFVDGSITAPDEDDWLTANTMVTFWIFNTIVPRLRSSITHREIAKDLWDSIKARFSAKSEVKVQQLKEELMNCKQCGVTLEVYYAKLQVIWEDLENYEYKAVCNCGGCKCTGCTCDIVKGLEKARENEKLHQFLLGLDASIYGAVRSVIVNMEPLPNLDHAYSMVSREEQM